MPNDILLTLNLVQVSVARLYPTNAIKADAEDLNEKVGELKAKAALSEGEASEVATALAAIPGALPGAVSGILLAVDGFNNGDALTGAQGLMDACASLAPAIGAAIGAGLATLTTGVGGPVGAQLGLLVGSLIGSIFQMIGNILGYFAPKAESLASQLDTLLKNNKADEVYAGIGRVHHSFLVYASSLNKICTNVQQDLKAGGTRFDPLEAAKIVDQMNFIEGNTMTTYWDVMDWLSSPVNQNHRLWPLILNAAVSAYSTLLLAIMRLQSLVTQTRMLERFSKANDEGKREIRELWTSATAKLKVFGVVNTINLSELKALSKAVQNHGTLWQDAQWLKVGVVDPLIPPSALGGNTRRFSVAVASKDQTVYDRAYHFYAIDGHSHLYHWKVVGDTSKAVPAFRQASDEGDSGQSVNDVFATTGVDLTVPSHTLVYTISGGNTIEGRFFGEDGKPTKGADGKPANSFYSKTFPVPNATMFKDLIAVRAVHHAYTYPDDPASGALDPYEYLVYATSAITATFGTLMVSLESTPWFFHTPVQNAIGIELDQDYLWVYSDSDARCATHASIVKAARSRGTLEADWITWPGSPDNAKINRLYPSDDATLIIDLKSNGGTYSADYHVDLKKKKITSIKGDAKLQWTKVRDSSDVSMEKLPLYCWPLYEGLKDNLEALEQAMDPSPVPSPVAV